MAKYTMDSISQLSASDINRVNNNNNKQMNKSACSENVFGNSSVNNTTEAFHESSTCANSKLSSRSFKCSNNDLESNVPSIKSNGSLYTSNILSSSAEMAPLLQTGKQSKENRAALKLQLNENSVSSKPKLVIKTIHENPIHRARESPQRKAADEEDRPVLHVQFDSEEREADSSLPAKEPCLTPTASVSSSSSSSSSSESIELSEARPPDGGWGWVIVAVSFIVNVIADGITFSFGVIFPEFLNYFGEDRSKTAWIGSLFMAMPLLSGPIASFLTDRYGCRSVTIVGSLLASSGFVLSSFANSTEVLYLTFGVLAGCGLSLCYVASVVIVAYYFDKKRSFATGLAVCGSGIGTFIFAPLIQGLLKEYGWRGTTLILAGIFLNLAVCGALMRDLPWTSYKNKSAARERKRKRSIRRKRNDSSADTFSVSNSTNTASALQPIVESNENGETDEDKQTEQDRMSSSLVNLPTFVRNGEKVPIEVLELLSTHKNVYNVLLQNYPSLLAPSRSFSDSGRLHKAHLAVKTPLPPSPLTDKVPPVPSISPTTTDGAYLWWLKRNEITPPRLPPQKRLPTAYLKDLRVHRLSLTYRGAMLNINRYRLRASSCPDIYRNSMTTIAKEKMQWYAGLWDLWDLVVDIIDFSHFANAKYLLFAISNFLLYTWYDVEYMYLNDHALGLKISEEDASMLISVIGIVNMFGEIILGWAGDRPWINPSVVYAICMCLCGAVIALVPLLDSYLSLCLVAGGFGFFIAANYSLTCIILVELITLERFTNAYGLLLLVQGVANLIGPPIAGKISDVTGTYDLSFFLAGIFIILSGLMLLILPVTNKVKRYTLQRQESTSDNSNEESKWRKILNTCIKSKTSPSKCAPENHV
ncbi:uncharacterized protein LOC116179864 [Photinus pyralis]|uniref:Major facilitator superfamily (MFS) profile domain-containing protein n=1 Tax=Photinus pyralis TaxID=7054 RepID=A0A1Y1M0L3_PHOPY|nr:uncharacterized protein LOC116179864 [Photinus pyralis]XP_031355588.1 uncharacterized protein LOC116179864 [Photinus pyralis]XP_031355589.1 uncharacterized protein LOC116179864 [Photinus pyralis]